MQTGVVSEYGKRDRENYRVASGWMMTVTVPGGGDGGERVPSCLSLPRLWLPPPGVPVALCFEEA